MRVRFGLFCNSTHKTYGDGGEQTSRVTSRILESPTGKMGKLREGSSHGANQ